VEFPASEGSNQADERDGGALAASAEVAAIETRAARILKESGIIIESKSLFRWG
jgi:hypothetical protein